MASRLALFALAVLAIPLVPNQFFPSSDRPELLVDLSLPQNASIYASESAAQRFDAMLKGDPDVERWSTYVGRGAIRFYLPLNAQLPNDFFAQAVIVAKDVPARDRLHAKLEKVLADQFPSVVARVYPLELGPPVGWPIQYRVSGPDIGKVREIALELAQIVAANPKAEHVNFDWNEPAREVRIRIDQDQARLLGLSSQALAQRAEHRDHPAPPITQVRDDIYLVDVVARATDEQRISLATLRTLQVPLPSGRTVPLSQFATLEFAQDYPLIWRRDRVPTLTVQADVRPGRAAGDGRQRSCARHRRAAEQRCRPATSIAVGGTVEESQKSQASVLAVVPAMLLIMFTVLMLQLKSFQRLFLVLSVAPLGLIGVVAALLAVGTPARLRRHPRHPRADRHDHQERRDPDRPDRGRASATARMSGRRRSMPAASASGRSC